MRNPLLPDEDVTPFTLRDAVTRTLPHGAFQIDPMPPERGMAVLRIGCRCGRALRWVGPLPSDVLLWWLADHDDDMFLTPDQLDRKYGEQIPAHLKRITLAQMERDLAGPFTGLLGPLGIAPQPEDRRDD